MIRVAKSGQMEEFIECLEESPKNINANYRGNSILHIACRRGSIEMVLFLYES